MPKIDIDGAPVRKGTRYPAPFDKPCLERRRVALGDAGGLTDFGVNLLTLLPGVWSSQRHWHSGEDEFVYVVSGEVVLMTDAGEDILRAGDCAGFPKGAADGHHLVNRSTLPATILEVGSRSTEDVCRYPDIDLMTDRKDNVFTHRDGKPYPTREAS